MIDKFSWISVFPEIILLVMACVIALADLAVKSPRHSGSDGDPRLRPTLCGRPRHVAWR